MPEFAYVARDVDGRTRRGTREAATESSLLERLRADGLFALEVRPEAASASGRAASAGGWFSRWLAPRPIDVELGLRQLATMQRSGLPLLSSLHLCASQSERRSMARVWTGRPSRRAARAWLR